MRARSATVVLFLALLLPNEGKAQVYRFRTPPPQVTAAAAAWPINGEAIVFDGLVYDATAARRPFDGNVMMQIGVFDNVPVYADATLEPFSVVYVPVSRDRMRQYERLRDGALAATTGSQAPSFPVQPTSGLPPERGVAASGVASVGPTGTGVPVLVPADAEPLPAPQTRPYVEPIPRSRATDGVWVRYDGAKWSSDGEADRTRAIGSSRSARIAASRCIGSGAAIGATSGLPSFTTARSRRTRSAEATPHVALRT